jgi:L,D-transpeptidase ErfK/SrfK
MRIAVALLLAGLALGPQRPAAVGGALVGAEWRYVTVPGDSLARIAGRHGVDSRTIARRNGLKPTAKLSVGQPLAIDGRHIVPDVPGAAVVVNIPQRMLFIPGDPAPRGYPVAVGRRGWRTPAGAFAVVLKEQKPTWDVPASIQEEMKRAGKTPLTHVHPGPANPLGDFWIGLSLPGIGIHGTNAPASVYTFATHGCIRVHPDNIAAVYDAVPLHARGEIIYEPVLLGVVGDRVFVEVHPDVYGRGPDALGALRAAAGRAGVAANLDWALAAEAVTRREGVAVDCTCRPRAVYAGKPQELLRLPSS